MVRVMKKGNYMIDVFSATGWMKFSRLVNEASRKFGGYLRKEYNKLKDEQKKTGTRD